MGFDLCPLPGTVVSIRSVLKTSLCHKADLKDDSV